MSSPGKHTECIRDALQTKSWRMMWQKTSEAKQKQSFSFTGNSHTVRIFKHRHSHATTQLSTTVIMTWTKNWAKKTATLPDDTT